MFREAPEGRAPRSHEVVERRREGLRGEEAGRDMPDAGGERPSVASPGLLGFTVVRGWHLSRPVAKVSCAGPLMDD